MVLRAIRRRGATIEEVDIDSDDTLTRDFGLRIPVVLAPDDVVIAEGQIERTSLRRALREWGSPV